MARYIDADKAIEYLQNHKRKASENNIVLAADEDAIIKFLREKCPTADVVEVVRCKDCRHKRELNEYERKLYIEGCVACSQISANGDRLVMLGDGFCSFGEREDT